MTRRRGTRPSIRGGPGSRFGPGLVLAGVLALGPSVAAGAPGLVLRVVRPPGLPGAWVQWEPHPLADEYALHRRGAAADPAPGALLDTTTGTGLIDREPGDAYYVVELTCTDEDDAEPNDTPEDAWRPDASGPPSFRGRAFMLCPGDEDWFRGEALAGGRLSGKLSFIPEEGERRLELLGGDPLELLAVGEGRSSHVIRLEAPWDGEYFFRVTGPDGAGDRYVLDLVYPWAPCEDEPSEPNDSPEDAEPVPVAHEGTATLCGLDEDWYAVQGPILGFIMIFEVELAEPTDADPVHMRLYDGDGTTLLGESDSGFLSTQSATTAPVVYLQVSNPDALGDGPYLLRIRAF